MSDAISSRIRPKVRDGDGRSRTLARPAAAAAAARAAAWRSRVMAASRSATVARRGLGPITLSCDPICERRAQHRGQNRDQTEVKTEIKSCAGAQVPTLFPHLPATFLLRVDVALRQWFPVPWLECCRNSCEPCFATLRVDRPWSARMARARVCVQAYAHARTCRVLRFFYTKNRDEEKPRWLRCRPGLWQAENRDGSSKTEMDRSCPPFRICIIAHRSVPVVRRQV